MQTEKNEMALNAGQTEALAALAAFIASTKTTFSLQGGAGVGKTFLVAEFVKSILGSKRVVIAAPTHKACRVLRAKLSAAGIPWVFKPAQDKLPGLNVAIVDTTAALLGVRPVIAEEQDDKEIVFKASDSSGSLPKYFDRSSVLVVDEVSMVGADDLVALKVQAQARDSKIVAVGDEGQLPPVKKLAIDFSKDFDGSYTLREVVRQAADSAIISLAWAIRNDEPDFENVSGKGLVRSDDVVGAFLAQVALPVDDEGQRSVFVAYRNATVDAVQEKACRKLYGHSSKSFQAGELVLATRPAYTEVYGTYTDRNGRERPSKFPKVEQICANADQLRVLDFDDSRRHPLFGVPVTLDRVDLPADADGKVFESFYLSAAELADPKHAFNVEKARLSDVAKVLQAEVKALRAAGNHDKAAEKDGPRKSAWAAFFAHEQKIISFAHPFAITSHKSQGSTYREVFVATAELLRFNKKALYVAVTRPSATLHW
jgi:exodeoxyribonuclease-5